MLFTLYGYYVSMNTMFIPVRVDTRGSVNLPASIKTALNVGLGATVLVRQINGVVVLVPMNGEAECAAQEERLNEWVSVQLGKPVQATPIQASKTAIAESIKLQTMRERFEQRRQLLELELQLAQAKLKQRQLFEDENSMIARAARVPVDGNAFSDAIALLNQSRAAEGDHQLAATLHATEQADAPKLPQAELE